MCVRAHADHREGGGIGKVFTIHIICIWMIPPASSPLSTYDICGVYIYRYMYVCANTA